jgi:hypothetical protein
MRLSRLFALSLAAITALFAIVGWMQAELGGLELALLGTGSLMILGAGLGRSRSATSRWLLVIASTAYTLLALAALGLQVNQTSSLFVRTGLSSFLLLGILLCLRCAYQLNRTTRYGFHNYYDRPR